MSLFMRNTIRVLLGIWLCSDNHDLHSLQCLAETIACQYSGTAAETYKSAAQTLRFQYWDWAVSPNLPPATTIPTLRINGPAGLITMRNPLYSYQIQTFTFTDPDYDGAISQ